MPYVYVGQTGRCVDCEGSFPRTASTKVRCAPCQSENRRQQATRKLERKRDQYNATRARVRATKLGAALLSEPVSCGCCAAPFIRRSAYARFCDPCRAKGKWARIGPEQRDEIKARRRVVRARRQRADPAFALNKRMSAGILHSLKTVKGGRRWESLVDYTLVDLMRHLERQFLPGMSWDNRSKWDIDHIVPLAAHSFEATDDPEFAAAWALTNLRPLWKVQNIKKSARRTHLL